MVNLRSIDTVETEHGQANTNLLEKTLVNENMIFTYDREHYGRLYYGKVHYRRVYYARVYYGRVYHGRVHYGREYHDRVYYSRMYFGRVDYGRVYDSMLETETAISTPERQNYPSKTLTKRFDTFSFNKTLEQI